MNYQQGFKIALIGCGTWGANHAMLYFQDPRVELTAVCDQDETKAADVARRYGNVPYFTDYRAMLRETECDAVSIVTPDFAHRECAVYCAGLGKHMLIEKPLATTKEDADCILQAARENNVRVMVDFHNRWNPPFNQMKREIEAGEIGEPYSGYLRLNDCKWVATRMLSWAQKSSILWFLGSHAIDTLRWLFQSEASVVYAVSRKGILQAQGVDTVDLYQYTVTFENGCIAQIENGWVTPDTNPNVNDFTCAILGTKGLFHLNLSNHDLIQRFSDKVCVPDILVNHYVDDVPSGFAFQSIRHFVDRMIDGKPFGVSLEDAYNNTITLLHVMKSAESGEPMRIHGLISAK